MKKQTLAACVCAAITLGMSSCFLFGKKDKTPSIASSLIIGKWQVTNLTDTNGQPLAISRTYLAPIKADAAKTFANFGAADSSLVLSFSTKDDSPATKYYLDTAGRKLLVKEEKVYDTFSVLALTDSMMHLTLNNIDVKLKRLP